MRLPPGDSRVRVGSSTVVASYWFWDRPDWGWGEVWALAFLLIPSTRAVTASTGVGQLFNDDSGRADLLDSQYFLFSLLLLGYFLTQFLSAESTTLPKLPDTLVGLTGVSAVGYAAKKSVKNEP